MIARPPPKREVEQMPEEVQRLWVEYRLLGGENPWDMFAYRDDFDALYGLNWRVDVLKHREPKDD